MASLITMGNDILAVQKTQEIFPIGVKNVYSLDFDKCNAVYHRIASQEDCFALQFKKALQGEYLKERYRVDTISSTALAQLDIPQGHEFVKLILMYRKIRYRILGQLNCFTGMNIQGDPFLIKEGIDAILGIVPSKISLREKELNFKILIETGFLKTQIKTVSSYKYHPGIAAKHMLNNDPSIKTMILGCGRNINHVPSCAFEAHENALFVDENPRIASDVVTDMHKKRFWHKLPKGRLESVLDHTNGSYIFDRDHTMGQIYRVLQQGGKLALARSFKEPDNAVLTEERRKILQSAGFKVESDDQMIFIK